MTLLPLSQNWEKEISWQWGPDPCRRKEMGELGWEGNITSPTRRLASPAHYAHHALLLHNPDRSKTKWKGMKLIVGSPGTWSGMALRVSQFVFAVASMCAMVTASGNSNYSAFFYMNFTMGLQLLWSLALACVDIFSIRNKKDLHNREIVSLIVFGDWIMSVFAFSGVCASASVMILFAEDMNFCRIYWRLPCGQFALSIVLASIVWSLDAASSLSGFWLLVSFF